MRHTIGKAAITRILGDDAHKAEQVERSADRLADLMKQGFMKPRKAPRPKNEPAPIVVCNLCINWHRKGKHTADKATRDARKAQGDTK